MKEAFFDTLLALGFGLILFLIGFVVGNATQIINGAAEQAQPHTYGQERNH